MQAEIKAASLRVISPPPIPQSAYPNSNHFHVPDQPPKTWKLKTARKSLLCHNNHAQPPIMLEQQAWDKTRYSIKSRNLQLRAMTETSGLTTGDDRNSAHQQGAGAKHLE